jgi:tricorn protease
MAQSGYYRFPTIHHETVVFSSEDDLWSVPAGGGIARRLTSSLSEAARPFLSPDGQWLAFMARDEGHHELYAMPAAGGEARRLTFFGSTTRPVGWSRDGEILFVTNYAQPFPRIMRVFAISPEGGEAREVPVGPAHSISLGSNGRTVIGRNTSDPAIWKRYRGGTAGDLWVDSNGDGNFRRLITLQGNLASPMWVGERIYFLSDHEGYGNIYSCTPDGEDLRRHTDHEDFYARNASTDGARIVYHAGADLYLYDPGSDRTTRIDVEYHSPRTQRTRKFIEGAEYLQHYGLHPEGHSLALVLRGKPVTMGDFSGPAAQHGEPQGVRYRLAHYLSDGRRLVAVSDRGNSEALSILTVDGEPGEERIEGLDIGRVITLSAAPKGDRVAIANHRNETIVVDLNSRRMQLIDRSNTLHSYLLAWSPDGRWLAFNHADNPETSYLVVADVESGQKHQVTEPLLHDLAPAWDPEGKYLYFISYREFDPVYDNLHFDLGFPRGVRPYLLTLRKDIPDPFLLKPQAPKKPLEKELQEVAEIAKEEKDLEVKIDFDGITRRVLPFPVSEGKYTQVIGSKGKAYFVSEPIEGSLGSNYDQEPPPSGSLEVYDFESQKKETLATAINELGISGNGTTMVYRSGKKLRVLPVGTKPDANAGDEPGRESGWIDLSRPKISILPEQEWEQMFNEAWRLQRDYFWTEGMLGIDWDRVYSRYQPLLQRVGSRSEFSDLIWELHGELGTSHAYEMGGDYRKSPTYSQGFLAADFKYDGASDSWIVTHIVRGDSWSSEYGSPLETPGVNIREGDRLVAINGRKLTRMERLEPPQTLLVNAGGTEISITFIPQDSDQPRTATIRALPNETRVRYREWVNENRRKVHEATDGRVGYVHIPNMGPWGYSEFHRGFLSEVGRGSLIVDVRFNGGGHVSQLILEKLARKTIGYGLARYGMPEPYPLYSVSGPLVAITNENAGSDGDIFSHGFKLMKLGPLVGKRTWGGVVGIWPRNPLVDGSVTTQPEFSTWFSDVQWGVENYGTDPDIDIDIRPQDYVAGRDPQLERAIEEVLRLMQEKPSRLPDFNHRPTLAPGPLPKREIGV